MKIKTRFLDCLKTPLCLVSERKNHKELLLHLKQTQYQESHTTHRCQQTEKSGHLLSFFSQQHSWCSLLATGIWGITEPCLDSHVTEISTYQGGARPPVDCVWVKWGDKYRSTMSSSQRLKCGHSAEYHNKVTSLINEQLLSVLRRRWQLKDIHVA